MAKNLERRSTKDTYPSAVQALSSERERRGSGALNFARVTMMKAKEALTSDIGQSSRYW